MDENRLANCTSPYLQQHADNPVHWHPWDVQSLELARSSGKPILLSIGYSACHWCHVMAHESFEDDETAALMNERFINIKVDREERPDLDKIYQSAHQMIAQRPGGWPLTVFLTPDDHLPFFAGTYFPLESRFGLPAFKDVLLSIDDAYKNKRELISEQNQALLEALERLKPESQAEAGLDPVVLESARQQLARSFDETHGGFGQAPKFPHPTSLNRLLRHWGSTSGSDARALYIVDHTLTRMALGGIHDQLGGGFCRYSVDDQWMIPHFEKMLYDNGPLLCLYSDLWQITGKPLFRKTAQQCAEWVMREMQSADGGYYSTLDADSEGEEGLFYVWTPDRVRQHLSPEQYQHFSLYYGLDQPANFEGEWHLHNRRSIAEINDMLGSTSAEAHRLIDESRAILFRIREQRIHPGRDEKILTAWNALMIKGMARAGRRLGHPELIESATRAAAFIHQQLWREGRLLATHRDGVSALPAYLDDYALLIDALLELLQARWSNREVEWAIELAEALLNHFQDPEGGFFFTADDHEELIYRPKPLGDDAIPSGNGVAAYALGRLGHLLGEMRYLEAGRRTLTAAASHIQQIPQAHCSLLEALEESLYPTETLIIRGSTTEMALWQQRAEQHYAPRRMVFAIPADTPALSGLLAERKAGPGCLAYLCRGTHCEAPIDDLEQLSERLAESESSSPGSVSSVAGDAGSFRRHRE